MRRFLESIGKQRFRAVLGGLLALAAMSVVIAPGLAASGTDTITTLAGTGVAGFSGDTGQASLAQLDAPPSTPPATSTSPTRITTVSARSARPA
jgi:hypothetical protein